MVLDVSKSKGFDPRVADNWYKYTKDNLLQFEVSPITQDNIYIIIILELN